MFQWVVQWILFDFQSVSTRFSIGFHRRSTPWSPRPDSLQGSQPLARELRGGQLPAAADRREAMSRALAAEAQVEGEEKGAEAVCVPAPQPLCLAERSYKESGE